MPFCTEVLLDHNSPLGFKSVAEARELLLNLGRREVETRDLDENVASGSHVVAPVRAPPQNAFRILIRTGI
jgi:hypothetical protein